MTIPQPMAIPQPTATTQFTATSNLRLPPRSTFHDCLAIHYCMATLTGSLTTVRNPGVRRMAHIHYPLALVHQAWLSGDPDPMLISETHLFLEVPRLNIRALTLAISHPPRLQQTIQLNHILLPPAVHLLGIPARIYGHLTQK